MLIEIDLDTCEKLQVTPNQLIFVKLLIEKNQKNIKKYSEVSGVNISDVDSLIERDIIQADSRSEDFTKLVITDEFLNSLDQKDFFDEFYEEYPKLVVRSDGIKDYLRTDINRCRKYYNQQVGRSKLKHENIMKCLRYEVDYRRKSGNMSYMKRMPKWLLSEEWTVYEQMIADSNVITQKEVQYGSSIE